MNGHGGSRPGAGRPRQSWRRCKDEPRPRFEGWRAFHITLRVDSVAVGRLRERENYHAIRKSMQTAWTRDDFGITQISLERDHIHLLVEAASSDALERGMRGFMISAARRLNGTCAPDEGRRARLVREYGGTRVIGAQRRGRRGAVFVGRYRVTAITSPWQARNALRYVLNNYRHHGEGGVIAGHGAWAVDYYSSGPSFAGWSECASTPRPFPLFDGYEPLQVKPARTWFLAEGWRKYGPISLYDVPGTIQVNGKLIPLRSPRF